MTKLCEEGKFNVTFDPLDGSSVIDSNVAIGTIVAIWKREPGKDDMDAVTIREHMVGAALSCYGSRTNIVVFNDMTNTVDELTLQRKSEDEEEEEAYMWEPSKKNMRIAPEGKYFSPGNIKSMKYNKGYKDAIQYWMKAAYTMRYSGGMAPDCFHIFMKG